MNPPPIPVPLPPASPNWRNAFGGIWRLTWPRFFSVKPLMVSAVLLLVFALVTWAAIENGNPRPFFTWTSVFYLGGVVPVLAFLSGASAIRDDMEPGPVDYILTRPVKRSVYVISRYICHVACMQIVYLPALAVLVGVGFHYEIPDLASRIPVLFLAQFLVIFAFSALGTLTGAWTSRYLIVGLLYGGIVEVGVGNTPIQLNRLSILRHIRNLLESALGNEGMFMVSVQGSFATSAYILLFVAVALTGAALLFSIREFAGQQPKEG
jgi:ABC-2 type transport system permease protein